MRWEWSTPGRRLQRRPCPTGRRTSACAGTPQPAGTHRRGSKGPSRSCGLVYRLKKNMTTPPACVSVLKVCVLWCSSKTPSGNESSGGHASERAESRLSRLPSPGRVRLGSEKGTEAKAEASRSVPSWRSLAVDASRRNPRASGRALIAAPAASVASRGTLRSGREPADAAARSPRALWSRHACSVSE